MSSSSHRLRSALALSVLALISLAHLSAQSAPVRSVPPTSTEETIELSPFVIATDKNTGYLAATTLSGTRLRTSLEDIGASISVVTKDLMVDLAATNLRDILVYTTGTEVNGVGGNFSGAALSGDQFQEPALQNQAGTRVRGLASADVTRGYFRTDIQFNAYNADRLEINRGANAIMFGVGSPAGIINSNPDTAMLGRTDGTTEIAFDQFGSRRISANVNVAGGKQFAVRVAGLSDHRKFEQDPAYNNEDRAYGAITWKPDLFSGQGALGSTTLRANYEAGRIDANNPRSLPPQDRITFWFEPTALYTQVGILPKATFDARRAVSQTGQLAVAQNLNRAPVIVFPDPANNLAIDPVTQAGLVPNVVGRAFVTSNFIGTAAGGQLAVTTYPTALRQRSYADSVFFVTPTLKDDSVFNFRDTLIDGPNKEENTRFHAYNIGLEQLFFKGEAGIELVFDQQKNENYGYSLIPRGNSYISIDPNTYMWDGTPNPNFGRAFTATAGSQFYGRTDRETFRGTAFYEFNTRKVIGPRWARILGRHIFTGLYQNEETRDDTRSGVPFTILGDFPYANNQDRTQNLGKLITTINYLGPSLANASTARNAALPGITANRLNLPSLVRSGTFLLRKQAANSPIEYVNGLNIIQDDMYETNAAASALKSRREIESKAVSWQSYFLDNNLVGTLGWRWEDVKTSSVRAQPNGVEGNVLVNDPTYSLSGQPVDEFDARVMARGLVAKVPSQWVSKVPGLSRLNFHYSDSENFSPPQGRRFDPFGSALTPPAGSTKEYGFTLASKNNWAVFRATWYKTEQTNVNNDTVTGAINAIMNIHNLAFQSVLQGYSIDTDGDKFPNNYVKPSQAFLDLYNTKITGNTLTYQNPGVVGTSDYVARGVEMELYINPTKNWTITVNAAKQESVRSNSAEAFKRFLSTPTTGGKSFLETWLASDVPLFAGATPASGGTVGDYTQRFIKTPLDQVALQDNGPVQELRRWRWNAVSNYRFTHGWLNGLGVGGAIRWQDKVAIGYPVITAGGQRLFDVAHPYYGPTDTNLDAWLSYSHRLSDKVRWKIQLNARNILENDDLIPVQTQPTGEVAVYRIPQPLTWTLTNTFSF